MGSANEGARGGKKSTFLLWGYAAQEIAQKTCTRSDQIIRAQIESNKPKGSHGGEARLRGETKMADQKKSRRIRKSSETKLEAKPNLGRAWEAVSLEELTAVIPVAPAGVQVGGRDDMLGEGAVRTLLPGGRALVGHDDGFGGSGVT